MGAWRSMLVFPCYVYGDTKIINSKVNSKSHIISIEMSLTTPRIGTMREADREALKQGYSLFSPFTHLIESLTKRVISLTHKLRFN